MAAVIQLQQVLKVLVRIVSRFEQVLKKTDTDCFVDLIQRMHYFDVEIIVLLRQTHLKIDCLGFTLRFNGWFLLMASELLSVRLRFLRFEYFFLLI